MSHYSPIEETAIMTIEELKQREERSAARARSQALAARAVRYRPLAPPRPTAQPGEVQSASREPEEHPVPGLLAAAIGISGFLAIVLGVLTMTG
jgi:hypothetical protein